MTNQSEETPRKKGKLQAVAVPPPALSPAQRVDRAIEADKWEVVEKLWALQERWDTKQAERAFRNAIANAKADIPVIEKTRRVSFGTGRAAYWYEDLAEIQRSINPILSAHGLSYYWRTHNPDPKAPISVTCVVSHRDGHFIENTLSGWPDESGSKNPIQAVQSTVTYLERITLKAALGLAAGRDDDARGADRDTAAIDSEQLQQLDAAMKAVKQDTRRFLDNYQIESLPDLPARQFQEAMDFLERKKTKLQPAEEKK